jgi:hypothetical protein
MIRASKYYFELHELRTRKACAPVESGQILRSRATGLTSIDKTPFTTERMHIYRNLKDYRQFR